MGIAAKHDDSDKLVEAIVLLAHVVKKASNARSREFDWYRSHIELATKCDLKEMECRIMAKISDFLTKQEAFNAEQETAIDEVVAAVGGVSGDVAELNRIIKELQESSGGVTPEDQARIDALETKGAALGAKLKGASDALKALDEQTPPPVPPPGPI